MWEEATRQVRSLGSWPLQILRPELLEEAGQCHLLQASDLGSPKSTWPCSGPVQLIKHIIFQAKQTVPSLQEVRGLTSLGSDHLLS